MVQIKTVEREGYPSAQLSFDEVKEHRVTQPVRGHFKRANVAPARVLREFKRRPQRDQRRPGHYGGDFPKGGIRHRDRNLQGEGLSRGGEAVPLCGRSCDPRIDVPPPSRIDRGELFSLSRLEEQGNAGAYGKRAGDRGGVRESIDVRPEENLVFVKGSVPGSEKGLVLIHKAKRGKVKKQAEPAKKK
ncbi:MAG: hypothetical protein MPW15_03895 [Candidatus Manganitrophus sp.]|nr:hypothetical protein [Candidatus Manganitrophus sp.]